MRTHTHTHTQNTLLRPRNSKCIEICTEAIQAQTLTLHTVHASCSEHSSGRRMVTDIGLTKSARLFLGYTSDFHSLEHNLYMRKSPAFTPFGSVLWPHSTSLWLRRKRLRSMTPVSQPSPPKLYRPTLLLNISLFHDLVNHFDGNNTVVWGPRYHSG